MFRKVVDMVVVFGATGRTGRRVVELLCARGQPARVVLRPEADWPSAITAPTLELARADLARSRDVDRCLDGVTAVVYLAGSRPSLTAGSAALIQEYASFMNCVDAARKQGISGSFITVGVDPRPGRAWAERLLERTRARWVEYKLACEMSLVRTPLRYLVLRARALGDNPASATRIRFDVSPGSPESAEPLPRAALAALIAGAIEHGHTPRATTTIVGGRIGYALRQAVVMLRELAPDESEATAPRITLEPARHAAARSIKPAGS